MNISFGTCVDTFLLISVEAEPLGHRANSFQRDSTPALISTAISMIGGSGCFTLLPIYGIISLSVFGVWRDISF